MIKNKIKTKHVDKILHAIKHTAQSAYCLPGILEAYKPLTSFFWRLAT